LLRQFLALAFWAFGFAAAVNQRFEWMIAFLADVLEDRHKQLLTLKGSYPFKIRVWEQRKL
jgi:hypothetical protein